MIDVSHLTRRFGPLTAVDDVSFRVERGEVVGFLGANGAGKTTTLRMLTGFLPASSGRITIAGHDVHTESRAVRGCIGYLPEGVPLVRELRVEEMLAFQGRLHGLERARCRRRIGELLERVGLAERRRALVGSLSKGLRQRVGLAVALLPDPQVLILDEPTSGLDPVQRIEVRALVRELARDRTVLFSSHILSEVEAVAGRLVILQRGRVAADGVQGDLVRRLGGQAFARVEALLGEPEAARALLRALPGVLDVVDRGRAGIFHAFDVRASADVREDIGALAAQRGWPLRELSWRAPTLEQLFARIALDLGAGADQAPHSAPSGEPPARPLLRVLSPFESFPGSGWAPSDAGAGRPEEPGA
jgi:ABC-2 type transport system ATP-binding protein